MNSTSHSLVGDSLPVQTLSTGKDIKSISPDERNAFLLSLPAIELSKSAKDLNGKTFSYLEVIRYIGASKSHKSRWLCRCTRCGNYTVGIAGDLVSGQKMSCGCYKLHSARRRLSKDITGQRFGKLVAQKQVGQRNHNNLWLCLCDCGKTRTTTQANLARGDCKTCGADYHNPKLNPNLTDEQRITGRNFPELRRLRKQTLERDDYRCTLCGDKAPRYNVHHIAPWACEPDARFDLDNLLTLCIPCHTAFHNTHKGVKNTSDNFITWFRQQKEKHNGNNLVPLAGSGL